MIRTRPLTGSDAARRTIMALLDRLPRSRRTASLPPVSTEIHFVDDPELPIRLVRAAGPIDTRSIERLLQCWELLTTPQALHLDLIDAQITDVSTMHRLESALDHLERQRIDVRIVGLDPSHPTLAA